MNIARWDGKTALMMAARKLNLGIMEMLLEAGADPNARNQKDRTLLDFVLRQQFKKVRDLLKGRALQLNCVNLLLYFGAKVNDLSQGTQIQRPFPQFVHLPTKLVKILAAAGEKVWARRGRRSVGKFTISLEEVFPLEDSDEEEFVEDKDKPIHVSDVERSFTLKSLCRVSIRKHMLAVDKTNLFCRVPELELPTILTDYLLYDVPLQDVDEEEGLKLQTGHSHYYNVKIKYGLGYLNEEKDSDRSIYGCPTCDSYPSWGPPPSDIIFFYDKDSDLKPEVIADADSSIADV